MTPVARNLLFWTPRLLTLLFAVFLGMFALDVFSENRSVWSAIGALLIHLIPAAIVLLALAVAWRREWTGAVAHPVLGALHVVMSRGRFPVSYYAVISGPLFVIGVAFLLNCLYRTELRT